MSIRAFDSFTPNRYMGSWWYYHPFSLRERRRHNDLSSASLVDLASEICEIFNLLWSGHFLKTDNPDMPLTTAIFCTKLQLCVLIRSSVTVLYGFSLNGILWRDNGPITLVCNTNLSIVLKNTCAHIK